MSARTFARWAAAGVGVTVVILGMIAVRTARSITVELHPPQKPLEPRARDAARAALPGLEEAFLKTSDGLTLAAWYVPSRNGAAVVLAHGSGDNRADVLPEARRLTESGYGILAFEWRHNGASKDGLCTFGDRERRDFEAALDFVSKREDVSPGRIGAMGHSLGGIVVSLVAAKDPRVRAAALSATTPSLREGTEYEFRNWGSVAVYPALWTLEYHGIPVEEVNAGEAVAAISPRPVLVIGGSDDPYVPRAMTESFYAAARAPKELYIVPGAGHGHYSEAAGDAYLGRLVAFFDATLRASSTEASAAAQASDVRRAP